MSSSQATIEETATLEAAPVASAQEAAQGEVALFEAEAAPPGAPVPLQALPVQPALPPRQRLSCPHCSRPVRRCRRTLLQRWLTRNQDRARYRCTGPLCGWSGLLTRRPGPEGAPPPR